MVAPTDIIPDVSCMYEQERLGESPVVIFFLRGMYQRGYTRQWDSVQEEWESSHEFTSDQKKMKYHS